MTLRATIVALLVELVHFRVHGCGTQGAGLYRGHKGMVLVCVGVGSCRLATGRSGV